MSDKVILELKSQQSDFLKHNYIQIISHLKLWQKQLGLLVNFGLPKVRIKRVPYSEKQKEILENYDHIKPMMSEDDRKHLLRIRQAVLSVFEMHGLGYGEEIYQSLVEAELRARGVEFQVGRIIPIEYEGQVIRNYEMDILFIEDKYVCVITALHENVDFYDIARIKTYMRALGTQIGLYINFGKRQLEIHGVSSLVDSIT